MYAPIYLASTPNQTPEVAAEEHAILSAEGRNHVNGRYIANESDARQQRRLVAERRVREAARRSVYGECPQGACDGNPRLRLSTLLTKRERQQVDVGALDCMRTTHRDEIGELESDLSRGVADALLISAARIRAENVPQLTALIAGFPAHSVVGLVSDVRPEDAINASLLFGRAGIAVAADVRQPQGWRELRRALYCGGQPDAFMRNALATVLTEIASGGAPTTPGLNEFFRLAFTPRITSAKELSAKLGVLPSTLMSRFFRADLPSPKQYVAFARLVWAAHLAEAPAMSIAAISMRLNASSPQSFQRTVRITMGMSALQFRTRFDGAKMLEQFRSRFVTPHRKTLSCFDPLADSQCGKRWRSAGPKHVEILGQGRAA